MLSNRTGSAIVYFHAAQNIPPSSCLLAVPAQTVQLKGPDEIFSENHICSVLVDDATYPCLVIEIDQDLAVDAMIRELASPEKKLKFQKKAVRWSHDHALKQAKNPANTQCSSVNGQTTSRQLSNNLGETNDTDTGSHVKELEDDNVDEWDAAVMTFIIPDTLTSTDGMKIEMGSFFDDLANGDEKWPSALAFALKKIFTVEEFLNSVSSPRDLIKENLAELSLVQTKMLAVYSLLLHYCDTKQIPRGQTGQQRVIQCVNRLRNRVRAGTLALAAPMPRQGN